MYTLLCIKYAFAHLNKFVSHLLLLPIYTTVCKCVLAFQLDSFTLAAACPYIPLSAKCVLAFQLDCFTLAAAHRYHCLRNVCLNFNWTVSHLLLPIDTTVCKMCACISNGQFHTCCCPYIPLCVKCVLVFELDCFHLLLTYTSVSVKCLLLAYLHNCGWNLSCHIHRCLQHVRLHIYNCIFNTCRCLLRRYLQNIHACMCN